LLAVIPGSGGEFLHLRPSVEASNGPSSLRYGSPFALVMLIFASPQTVAVSGREAPHEQSLTSRPHRSSRHLIVEHSDASASRRTHSLLRRILNPRRRSRLSCQRLERECIQDKRANVRARCGSASANPRKRRNRRCEPHEHDWTAFLLKRLRDHRRCMVMPPATSHSDCS